MQDFISLVRTSLTSVYSHKDARFHFHRTCALVWPNAPSAPSFCIQVHSTLLQPSILLWALKKLVLVDFKNAFARNPPARARQSMRSTRRRFFALLCVFVAALLPWAAPENRTWMHKLRKNFWRSAKPSSEGECATFNARLHVKHGDQAAHLLCVSVHRHTFLWREHAHRPVGGAKSKGKGAPPTNGGGCRPGGEAGCQFRQQPIKDARFSFRPLTALGQYFHFFSSSCVGKKKIALRWRMPRRTATLLVKASFTFLMCKVSFTCLTWNTCSKLNMWTRPYTCSKLNMWTRP